MPEKAWQQVADEQLAQVIARVRTSPRRFSPHALGPAGGALEHELEWAMKEKVRFLELLAEKDREIASQGQSIWDLDHERLRLKRELETVREELAQLRRVPAAPAEERHHA